MLLCIFIFQHLKRAGSSLESANPILITKQVLAAITLVINSLESAWPCVQRHTNECTLSDHEPQFTGVKEEEHEALIDTQM